MHGLSDSGEVQHLGVWAGGSDMRPVSPGAQLVENPNDAAVFLPRLLPGLEKVSQEVPDPECRTVAAKARDTLLKIMPEGDAPAEPEAHDFKARGFLWRSCTYHQDSTPKDSGSVCILLRVLGPRQGSGMSPCCSVQGVLLLLGTGSSPIWDCSHAACFGHSQDFVGCDPPLRPILCTLHLIVILIVFYKP